MSCATELTVCLSVDFFCNDINERRLFGAACEGANVLHEVGEARWAPAENAFSFLDAMNQVFDLGEREVSEANSDNEIPHLIMVTANRNLFIARPPTRQQMRTPLTQFSCPF